MVFLELVKVFLVSDLERGALLTGALVYYELGEDAQIGEDLERSTGSQCKRAIIR